MSIREVMTPMQPSQNVPAASNFAAFYEISAAYYTLISSLNKSGLRFNLP